MPPGVPRVAVGVPVGEDGSPVGVDVGTPCGVAVGPVPARGVDPLPGEVGVGAFGVAPVDGVEEEVEGDSGGRGLSTRPRRGPAAPP
jgi:hypothetical protein